MHSMDLLVESESAMSGRIVALLLSVLAVAGCGINLPSEYPLSEYNRSELLGKADKRPLRDVDGHPPSAEDLVRRAEELKKLELGDDVKKKLADTLSELFGTPNDPDFRRAALSLASFNQLRLGSSLYQRHCIHCHGIAGGGNGPTADFLFPRPRDYRRGTFKWKSTLRNAKPTRDDLVSLIKNGAVGTSMPPFRLLPEEEIQALTDYVIFLSTRGELERKILQAYDSEQTYPDQAAISEMLDGIEASWKEAADQSIKPDENRPVLTEGTKEHEDSVQRGLALYKTEKAACIKCHGKDGQANPLDWAPVEKAQMMDDWGHDNYPRNLRLGMFRGGRRPIDLYRRIHQGIAGASMPAGGTNLKPAEIWDLVNFVRALPYRDDLLAVVKEEHSHGAHGSQGGH